MRLKSIYIGQYKNLKDFTLDFNGNSFIDVFVGKNATGKSNLFEALIEIFRHIVEFDREKAALAFNYRLNYEIDGRVTEINWDWKSNTLRINGKKRKTIGKTPLPDNLLIYYSGHNDTVSRLVDQYEVTFRKNIKSANIEDSRRFIGIGPKYKSLLLATLLAQPVGNKAREFLSQKLGVTTIGTEMQVQLKRPSFADGRLKALSVDSIESFDSRTHYWGADGISRDFLDKLILCVKGEFKHDDVYNPSEDRYRININLKLFQKHFPPEAVSEVFRQLDNLKTLGILADISIPLQLTGGMDADVTYFSDGQFQSVYIYSIVELFKDRNCITLLDEPDAFLHPEWQFDFLKQVFEITDTAAKNNHVLMSSHSAVTLIPHNRNKIMFFDIKDNHVNCYGLPKTIAIKKLSSDLIRYSEQEQILSIINAIQIEHKPVLFTEGSTDPIILKEAWYKLFDDEAPFIPFYAFSSTYMKRLITDNRIHEEMGGLPIFALFDFDKAYDQWNGLNGAVIESDPVKGMVKKWDTGESYAIMVPIPDHAVIRKQVIKNSATNETFGGDSCCEIELLFYGQNATADYYIEEPCVGGTKIVFKSDRDKTAFAKDIIPKLDAACFEVFRPMLEFIRSKCPAFTGTGRK